MSNREIGIKRVKGRTINNSNKKTKLKSLKKCGTQNELLYVLGVKEHKDEKIERCKKNNGSKIICHKNSKNVVKKLRPGGTTGGGGAVGKYPKKNSERQHKD